MKFTSLILAIVLIHGTAYTQDQASRFDAKKSGKFILQNQLNKCQGDDIVSLAKNLTVIAEWIHRNNSIVNLPVGFDAFVSLSGNSCDKDAGKVGFGMKCRISLSFRYFYFENKVSLTATDWAAHGTEIQINNPINLISTQFTETGFKTDDPPRLKQPLEKALENLKQYYSAAPILKEIAPGVRLYDGGHVLVFNPDRPDIWIPVTVKEIMEAKLAYYKIKQEIDSINYEKTRAEWAKLNFKPDQVIHPNIYEVITKEFENFSPEELNRPAYSSPQSGISGINAHGEGLPVVRFNRACWNRALPATSVQFMTIEFKLRTKAELNQFERDNGGLLDYVGLYTNNLPVEKMAILIQKN